jgi:hypothetical protein
MFISFLLHVNLPTNEHVPGFPTSHTELSPTLPNLQNKMFRIVFWDVLPCKIIVDNNFTWQYIPEDNSEHHTRRRENLKSHLQNKRLTLATLA